MFVVLTCAGGGEQHIYKSKSLLIVKCDFCLCRLKWPSMALFLVAPDALPRWRLMALLCQSSLGTSRLLLRPGSKGMAPKHPQDVEFWFTAQGSRIHTRAHVLCLYPCSRLVSAVVDHGYPNVTPSISSEPKQSQHPVQIFNPDELPANKRHLRSAPPESLVRSIEDQLL